MRVDVAKSLCNAFSRRFDAPCGEFLIHGNTLRCRYIGVYFISGRTLRCSYDNAKA